MENNKNLTAEDLHKKHQEEAKKRHEEFIAKIKERRASQEAKKAERPVRHNTGNVEQSERPQRAEWFKKYTEKKTEASEEK